MENKLLSAFNYLPSSMIGYILQFHTLKDLFEFSKVNRAIKNAMNQNFLWEQYASNEELFIPNEKEHFKWKDLFFYLYNLKKNIQGGAPNKNFKASAMRSHKVIISAINYLYIDNSYKVLSGDKEGVLLTWEKDSEGDYESLEILHAKEEIISIKPFAKDNKVLIVTDGSLYLIRYENKAFKVMSQYEKKEEEKDHKHIELYGDLVYSSIDFNDNYIIKRHEMKVIAYDPITWKKHNEMILSYGYDLQREIDKIGYAPNNSANAITNKTKFPSFTLMDDYLIAVTNYELKRKMPIANFAKDTKLTIDNCFIFNTKLGNIVAPKRMHIPLEYIYYLLPMNDANSNRNTIAFVGKASPQENHMVMLKYHYEGNPSNGLILNQSIDFNKSFSASFDLLYYSSTTLCFWNKHDIINIINLADPSNCKTVPISKGYKINHIECDKYRLIICYDTNKIDVFSMQSNTRWYSLMTGSLTIVPKSFVKHPDCVGFNNAIISRWSILGVLGNLIREYSFQPALNK